MQRIRCLRRREPLLLGPPCRKSLERRDLFFLHRRKRCYARADLLTVEQDGTGSALGYAAAELRTGKLQIISQDVKQRGIGGRLDLALDPIDNDRDHRNTPYRKLLRTWLKSINKIGSSFQGKPTIV